MDISTFDEDLIGLKEFSQRLEDYIAVEHNFVPGSLVIALSSKFGSGKSTFLRMWTAEIVNGPQKPKVISLNAWESDYLGDPLFAIVSSLAQCIEKSGKSPERLLEAAKDIGWYATAIGSQITRKFTGIDPVAAGEYAERKKGVREIAELVPMDIFSAYQNRKDAMGRLKLAIQEFVVDSEPHVLFLIDELDRCRPDYAISYLETIKHIFDVSGAVFILAADRHQLENSAKVAFGTELDFEEYYRKFVHREVTLPPISNSGYEQITEKYVNNYLVREGLRQCYLDLESGQDRSIKELLVGLKLTFRQMQEVFRILGHLLHTKEEKKGNIWWCLGAASVAMAAFKVGAPRVYQLLGEQALEPDEAIEFLQSHASETYVYWWFGIFLSGGGITMKKGESPEDIYKGLVQEGENSRRTSDLGKFCEGWGGSYEGRLPQIYGKIEQVSQWN